MIGILIQNVTLISVNGLQTGDFQHFAGRSTMCGITSTWEENRFEKIPQRSLIRIGDTSHHHQAALRISQTVPRKGLANALSLGSVAGVSTV